MTFIYFIILLGAIILVHEVGHFIMAKKFNVYTPEFSIGMGPKLFQVKRKETKYTIRLLPIGGYVAMAGEEGIESEEVPFERTLPGISHTKRVIIMLAGAFMNFLLAWVLFVGIFIYNGQVALPPEPVLGEIIPNSAAEEAGLQAGDRIQQVTFSDGTVIQPKTYYEFLNQAIFYDDAVQMKILRDGQEYDYTLTPRYDEEAKRALFGFYSPQPTIKKIGIAGAIEYGTKEIYQSVETVVMTLGKLVRGRGFDQLSGPVGIYEVTSQQVQYGFINFLALIGMMSVNIGVFNLLPLPILDGGRALLTAFEGITKIKINKRIETAFMAAGVILMLALFIYVTFQDITRLIGG